MREAAPRRFGSTPTGSRPQTVAPPNFSGRQSGGLAKLLNEPTQRGRRASRRNADSNRSDRLAVQARQRFWLTDWVIGQRLPAPKASKAGAELGSAHCEQGVAL